MDKAPKLKDELITNVMETVTMATRGKSYPSKYDGTMQFLYFFKRDGKDCIHYANEREEEFLKDYQPGESLQVVKTEGTSKEGREFKYLVWDAPGGSMTSAVVKAKGMSTLQMNKTEDQKSEYQDEQKIKGVEIGVRGIFQALVSSMTPDYAGTYDELIERAIKLDRKLREKSRTYASEL